MHLGDLLWSLLVIFFMVVYFLMLFRVIVDIFRDRTLGGWAKAGWLVFLLVVPLIALLVYVVARGSGLAGRDGSASSAADQIARAHDLLTSGAINQEEFEALKAKAIAAG